MNQAKLKPPKIIIKLLIVDDSWVLRRVLRGTLSQRDDVEIVGEATNGVEALELVMKVAPDVILLDVEMPTMDGMTTLQHLMIHAPTPTIMLSGLSQWGATRCFDALKYGAVDFVSKNSFFKGIDGTAHSKLVIGKVMAAAGVTVSSIDPMQQNSDNGSSRKSEKVVFCEECGTRHSIKNCSSETSVIRCKKCNDEIALALEKPYRRMNYLTVIGTGESGYGNLLKIIPELNPDMGGAIFVAILDEFEHVESFVKYLDSISDFQVALGENGATVEGGYCYLFSRQMKVALSPYSGQYCLKVEPKDSASESGVIDSLMQSASSLMGDRVSGVLLSGDEPDGSRGLRTIMENGGTGMILNPDHCLHKTMVCRPFVRYNLQSDLDEQHLAMEIRKRHCLNKENVITA